MVASILAEEQAGFRKKKHNRINLKLQNYGGKTY